MKHTTFALIPCLLSLAAGARAASLADIGAGEWFEAPDSEMESVVPAKLPEGSWNGFKAVMESWSGAGFDSKRDRLIVWGGGHHDYSGNEIYAFDVNKLTWSRLNEPSTDFGGDEKTGEYPDGKPRSRHTYNYIQYVPAIDRFCTLGGHGQFPSGQVGTDSTHCYDFEASRWDRMNAGAVGSIGAISGVDEATGRVFLHTSGGDGRLLEWNPTADAWTRRATYPQGWFDYFHTGAVGDGKFIAIGPDGEGKATLLKWELADPDAEPVIMDIPASVEAARKPNPGFAWDSKRRVFVAWSGGSGLWVLDPATLGWYPVPLAATNKVTPTAGEKLGTYGRFRYSPSKDVFLGVNRTSENVWLFRMPADLSLKIGKGSGPAPGMLKLEIAAGSRAYTREFPLARAGLSGEPVHVRLLDPKGRLVWRQTRAFIPGSRNRIRLPEAGAVPGHVLELDQGGRILLRTGL